MEEEAEAHGVSVVSNGGPAIERGETPSGVGSINVEALFSELRLIKAIGIAFTVVAALSAVLPGILVGGAGPEALPGIMLGTAGAAVGTAAFLAPRTRRVARPAAPILLLAAAAASPLGTNLDAIPRAEIAIALVFAISWFLSLEYMGALERFVELGRYVAVKRLSSFDLGGVINHFIVYGIGVVGLVAAVTLIVVVGIPWVFTLGSDPIFGRSAEVSSVFGVAIAAAIFFGLCAIILTTVRSVVSPRHEVDRVAYSRETMEDMLRGSRVLDFQRDREEGQPPR